MMNHLLVLILGGVLLVLSASSLTVLGQSLQPRQFAADFEEDVVYVAIEFSGNKIFSSKELSAVIAPPSLFDPEGSIFLLPGGPDGTDALSSCLERVRFFLGTKGYVLAKISEPKITELEKNVIKAAVTIEEGARYRIGQIAVKKANALSFAEIVEISGLRQGEPINAADVQEKIFKGIKDQYADRGYIQASVDFIPDFKLFHPLAPEGVVDVTLEMDEGRKFFVDRIDFYGELSEEAKANKQVLLDCLLLKEGDVYSRKLMFETLNNLNRLGWLEEIRDKDLIIRTNAEEMRVQIDIPVKEIKPSPQQ